MKVGSNARCTSNQIALHARRTIACFAAFPRVMPGKSDLSVFLEWKELFSEIALSEESQLADLIGDEFGTVVCTGEKFDCVSDVKSASPQFENEELVLFA